MKTYTVIVEFVIEAAGQNEADSTMESFLDSVESNLDRYDILIGSTFPPQETGTVKL